jgi:hypothetical protein
MHYQDGEIREYFDGEGSQESRIRGETHLADCPACHQRAKRLGAAAGEVADKLAALAPRPHEGAVSPAIAQARLRTLVAEKEKYAMQNRWLVRNRPALITAGLVLMLAVSLAFAPVRAIANSFLGLFRVQQLQIVEVNPGDLPEQLGSSYQLEYFMSNDVHIQQQGEDQTVGSAEDASALAGIPVRLPPGMNGEQHLVVTAPAQINFTVELALVQAVLDEIGRGDISLPEEIDGAEVTVHLPALVSASYGDCTAGKPGGYPEGYDPDDPTLTLTPNCTTLVQMPSPRVNAPEGLNLAQLGQAYLQLLGMAPQEAVQFSANIDWATTLVVPIPVYEASYREVEVDGVRGTLILGDQQDFGQQYMLIWFKDGIVYVLTGPGGASTAVRLADSIR